MNDLIFSSNPPNKIDSITKTFSQIPGIGNRSKKRILLFLLKNKETALKSLNQELQNLYDNVKKCECGNFDTSVPCAICSDPKRDKTTLCIVEDITSLWAIEKSESFNGVYYVLENLLSPMCGIGPQDIKIDRILQQAEQCSELIFALSATIEGQSTAHYIREKLGKSLKCSKLRLGMPVGSEIEHLDNTTIAAAITGRELLDTSSCVK